MQPEVNDITVFKEMEVRRRQIIFNFPNGKTKIISSPGFLAELKSSWDTDFLCKWIEDPNMPSANVQGIVVPITEHKRILTHKENSTEKLTLTGESVEKGYNYIKKNLLKIIDPLMESAYLKIVEYKEPNFSDLPIEYQEVVKSQKESNKERNNKIGMYANYVETIERGLTPHTLKFLNKAKKLGSEILLSPSPLIIPELPNTMRIAIEVNKKTHELCNSREGWIPASYFLFKSSNFDDLDDVAPILDYINKEKPSMIFFKLVDPYTLDSRNAGIQRNNLKRFLQQEMNPRK